ncbi:MAG: biotin--[acetyl-CoA-carboxylase] ligase [Candidatus Omnitrophica bacterium]|nr:biotin--[acetyl-CoA-carboxylase] ligase [Candidatus Omnitrophota bacterium]MDD5775255.1 biotin--[acetyl-CoA-carboxylase] ligase [Candidatus Omnitrophota bacterium]
MPGRSDLAPVHPMIQDDLLEYLRKKQSFVSGDELSRHLHISRAAAWKHILQLRGLGYDIASVPHLGYQLAACPDRLYPAEVRSGLRTRLIGRVVHYFDHVASTMDTAMRFAQDGAVEGTVVIAETQTRGRGRLGRLWASPKYKGIYCSVIVRPDTAAAGVAPITLMAAVSVCAAVRRSAGLDAQIKWPNDILLDNKKLGGILTEMNGSLDRVNYVIIGIGINVNDAPAEGATSLAKQSCRHESRVALMQELLRQIEQYYMRFRKQDLMSILEAWRQCSATLGRRVRIDMRSSRIDGTAVDIDADGGLLVRRDSGIIEKVLAGDVVHCR